MEAKDYIGIKTNKGIIVGVVSHHEFSNNKQLLVYRAGWSGGHSGSGVDLSCGSPRGGSHGHWFYTLKDLIIDIQNIRINVEIY